MVGTCARKSLLNRVGYKSELIEELAEVIELPFADEGLFNETPMPLQQQVVDKLADMLFASDMILDMLHDERHFPPPHLQAVEPAVRRLYDDVNELMKQLTD